MGRRLARAPIWLYRARLGWCLGPRFVLVEHTGRASGKTRQTVLEVIARDGEAQESPPASLQVNVEPPPEIPPPYGPIWSALDGFQSGLGVPVGEAVERFYAGQAFQHGFMVWRDTGLYDGDVVARRDVAQLG